MSIVKQERPPGTGARRPGWRRRRVWVRLLLWLLVPPAAIAAAFQMQPGPIVLDVPVAGNATGYFWWEEHRTELTYADSPGVLYVLRRVGSGFAQFQGWHTVEEVHAHFDKWLTANGWTYVGEGYNTPPIPESRFFKPEQSRRYRHGNDRHMLATVTVWQRSPTSESFDVFLTTERASWGRRFGDVFD